MDRRIPTVFIGTVFLINLVGNLIDSTRFSDPLLSILTGALLLGAFFLATDPVTSPVYPYSKIFYGIGLGIITVVIRNFGAFNEGVMFAIILMNAVSPLLDSMKINRRHVEVLNEKVS
jgi:Na+-translocating ferredoxin:NAD+ oxidoreductase RnfD subunit